METTLLILNTPTTGQVNSSTDYRLNALALAPWPPGPLAPWPSCLCNFDWYFWPLTIFGCRNKIQCYQVPNFGRGD